jgi:hypothetical protein
MHLKTIGNIIACLSVLFCVNVFASTEEQRRLEYALATLDDVTTMNVWVDEIHGSWSTNVTKEFVGGVAEAVLNLTFGPATYSVGSEWQDKNGYTLFRCWGSLKEIKAGMNYVDLPMYIYYGRHLFLRFKQPEVNKNSEIWVNGNPAWFDGTEWRAYVQEPWNVTNLQIVWTGHGGWNIGVTPSFDYGQTTTLSTDDMDPTITSSAQAIGLSYLGETSWPTQQQVFVSDVQWDSSLGCEVLSCYNTIYKKYGSFKALVLFTYYDQDYTGERVQYFSKHVTVEDGMFTVPLVENDGTRFWGIRYRTQVVFVYEDPADSVVKQQWDSSIYFEPEQKSSSGGGGSSN